MKRSRILRTCMAGRQKWSVDRTVLPKSEIMGQGGDGRVAAGPREWLRASRPRRSTPCVDSILPRNRGWFEAHAPYSCATAPAAVGSALRTIKTPRYWAASSLDFLDELAINPHLCQRTDASAARRANGQTGQRGKKAAKQQPQQCADAGAHHRPRGSLRS